MAGRPEPGLRRFFQGATWLWAGIFLLLTASLAVLMVTGSAGTFLMLSSPLLRSWPPEPARPRYGSPPCCAGWSSGFVSPKPEQA